MKIGKIIAGVMAFCIVCGGLTVFQGGFSESAVVASDEDYTYGDFTYKMKNDGTIEITKFSGNSSAVDIPSEIGGKTVTSIGNEAFYQCTDIETVKIPENVKSIGENAFQECENLESVKIPDSVTEIGGGAFSGCINLETIVISKNITRLETGVFANCKINR